MPSEALSIEARFHGPLVAQTSIGGPVTCVPATSKSRYADSVEHLETRLRHAFPDATEVSVVD
jgi:hypothetical protein